MLRSDETQKTKDAAPEKSSTGIKRCQRSRSEFSKQSGRSHLFLDLLDLSSPRWHAVHVSQLLQRVWKTVSRSLLLWRKYEPSVCCVQAVHLYGHASGAHSWHIQRPSVFCRSCLIWNARWHELQTRKAYLSWR